MAANMLQACGTLNGLTMLAVVGWATEGSCAVIRIDWTAASGSTVIDSSDDDEVSSEVGGIKFYAFHNIDNGAGEATGITGSTALSGVTPADLTFTFGDLELTSFVGGPPTSFQVYGEGDGSPNFFNLFQSGVLLAGGEYLDSTVTVDYNTGVASAFARIRLITAGVDPSFFNEVMILTGGSGRINSFTESFVGTSVSLPGTADDDTFATFDTSGFFEVSEAPEPSSAALAGLALCCSAVSRRRQRRQRRQAA